MQRNPDYEAEVNLKNLFFSVLYRWRSILAAALIGAVLLGVYQFVSLETVHRKGERTEEERQYEIDLQAYHASMDTFQADIETYTNLIAARKEYRNNSPYLKLDPQKIWFAEKRYYVEVDPSVMEALPAGSTIDPADYVLSVYSSAMRERRDVTSSSVRTCPFTDTWPSALRLRMISPGIRPGIVALFAVGSVIDTSVSHWEKTLDVTKKQRSRKTTSIKDAICTVGAELRLFFRKFMRRPSQVRRRAFPTLKCASPRGGEAWRGTRGTESTRRDRTSW